MDYNITWIITAAILAALPVPFIKNYIATKNYIWIFLSVISYLILIMAYANLFSGQNIVAVYSLIKILSIIIVTVFGIVLFKNKLTVSLIVGILFGIVSIYLLSQSAE